MGHGDVAIPESFFGKATFGVCVSIKMTYKYIYKQTHTNTYHVLKHVVLRIADMEHFAFPI